MSYLQSRHYKRGTSAATSSHACSLCIGVNAWATRLPRFARNDKSIYALVNILLNLLV